MCYWGIMAQPMRNDCGSAQPVVEVPVPIGPRRLKGSSNLDIHWLRCEDSHISPLRLTCNCFNSPAGLPGRPITYKAHRRLRSGKSYAPHGKDMQMARELLKRQFGGEALVKPVAILIRAYGRKRPTALQAPDVALQGQR